MKAALVLFFYLLLVLLFIVPGIVSRHPCPDVSGCTCSGDKFVCNSTVNSLTSIPHPLPEDTTVVNVSSHNVSNISHENFRGLFKLKYLLLPGNSLENIPNGTLTSLTSLVNIRLMRNHLQHINEFTFKGLTNLRFLQLAYNQISFIDRNAFTDLTNLGTLRIEGNRLKFLSNGLFRNVQLSVLGSFNNPWVCDCNLLPFILYANTHNTTSSPRCDLPLELSRVAFSSLTRQSFSCNDHQKNLQSSIEILPTTNHYEHIYSTEWRFTSTTGEPDVTDSTLSMEDDMSGLSVSIVVTLVATLVIMSAICFLFAIKRVIGTHSNELDESTVLRYLYGKDPDNGDDQSVYLTPCQVNMYQQIAPKVNEHSFQRPGFPSEFAQEQHHKKCAIAMNSDAGGSNNSTATYANIKEGGFGKRRAAFYKPSTDDRNPIERKVLPPSLPKRPSTLEVAETQGEYENTKFKKKTKHNGM